LPARRIAGDFGFSGSTPERERTTEHERRCVGECSRHTVERTIGGRERDDQIEGNQEAKALSPFVTRIRRDN
jgi:hypothetical protein